MVDTTRGEHPSPEGKTLCERVRGSGPASIGVKGDCEEHTGARTTLVWVEAEEEVLEVGIGLWQASHDVVYVYCHIWILSPQDLDFEIAE